MEMYDKSLETTFMSSIGALKHEGGNCNRISKEEDVIWHKFLTNHYKNK